MKKKQKTTFIEIYNDLQSGHYNPVYFLMGDEPYFIDVITEYLTTKLLNENEKAFNQHILYGRDITMPEIANIARRFPMMSERQLVVVKEAQNLRSLDGLESYLSNPMPSTVFVICYKNRKLDGKTKISKLLDERFVLFHSEKLYESKVPSWINSYLKTKNFGIDEKAAVLLVDFLGNDLSKLANELDKLIMLLPAGRNIINPADIEKNIGINKDYNNFELTNALGIRDVVKANMIIGYFKKNPRNNPMMLTISSIFYFFSKLLLYHAVKGAKREELPSLLGVSPYFVNNYLKAAGNYPLPKTLEVISLLREYDMKTKGMGSNAAEGELTKELVYKILH